MIYILGFGFDKYNIERLGLGDNYVRGRTVLFTNMDDHNRVNKRVEKMFGTGVALSARQLTVEKSVRKVYDALNVDFESFDDLVQ